MEAFQQHAAKSLAAISPRPRQGWLELHRESHGPRRRPRASVDVPVRLSGEWTDGQGAYVPVLGRCRDLSESGMALSVPVTLEVGSRVTCSLRLDGSPVYMQGKVIWRRRPLERCGPKLMGIEFTEASDADRASVRRVLAKTNHRKGVQLRFPDSPEPVFAMADIDDGELNVVAPLNLFRVGKPVRVSFEVGGPSYDGEVAEVHLDQRGDTPTLRARIRVGDTQMEAFRATVRDVSRERIERQERQESRRRWSAVVWAGVLGFATGAALWAFEMHRPPRLALSAPRSASKTAEVLVLSERAGEEITADVGLPAPSGYTPADARAVVTTSVMAASRPLKESEQASGAALQPKAGPAELEAPYIVRRDRKGIEVQLPSALAPKMLRHFRLAQPPGVGVDVEQPLVIAEGRYAINRDGVRWLRVTHADGRTQVRVYLRESPSVYTVESLASRLQVLIEGASKR